MSEANIDTGEAVFTFSTSIGSIVFSVDPTGTLTRLTIQEDMGTQPTSPKNLSSQQSAARDVIERQIHQYLAGTRTSFELETEPTGTPFQQTVWKTVQEVPYGTTVTYRHIAERLRSPGASRAVGNALKANPMLLIIPCHRIVPSSGGIGGFRAGSRIKKLLLDHEKRIVSS